MKCELKRRWAHGKKNLLTGLGEDRLEDIGEDHLEPTGRDWETQTAARQRPRRRAPGQMRRTGCRRRRWRKRRKPLWDDANAMVAWSRARAWSCVLFTVCRVGVKAFHAVAWLRVSINHEIEVVSARPRLGTLIAGQYRKVCRRAFGSMYLCVAAGKVAVFPTDS